MKYLTGTIENESCIHVAEFLFGPVIRCVLVWIAQLVIDIWNVLLTVPRWYFFCGSFMIFPSCICYVFVRVYLYVLSGHLLGKG